MKLHLTPTLPGSALRERGRWACGFRFPYTNLSKIAIGPTPESAWSMWHIINNIYHPLVYPGL